MSNESFGDIGYNDSKQIWVRSLEQILLPPKGVMLPWWPSFNKCLNGLRPNELTLLCAPTGAGKTQLLANISAQLCITQVSHFVAPVETGDVDFLIRVGSVLAEKDFNHGGEIGIEGIAPLQKKAQDIILKAPIRIASYDNRVKIEDMEAMLQYQYDSYGCKIALLDNLNFFLDVTRASEQNIEMDRAVHALVMFVKKTPMHIILVVHPKKTDGGRVESEFDIKGSSTAVQECSNVILFNRPKSSDIETETKRKTDRELIFKKIRKRGAFVNRPIWFDHQYCRYKEDSCNANF